MPKVSSCVSQMASMSSQASSGDVVVDADVEAVVDDAVIDVALCGRRPALRETLYVHSVALRLQRSHDGLSLLHLTLAAEQQSQDTLNFIGALRADFRCGRLGPGKGKLAAFDMS